MVLTITLISKLLGLNRKTVSKYFIEFREFILKDSIYKFQKEIGEFEFDESYFGTKRVRGKRGRGVAEKTQVFGVLSNVDYKI